MLGEAVRNANPPVTVLGPILGKPQFAINKRAPVCSVLPKIAKIMPVYHNHQQMSAIRIMCVCVLHQPTTQHLAEVHVPMANFVQAVACARCVRTFFSALRMGVATLVITMAIVFVGQREKLLVRRPATRLIVTKGNVFNVDPTTRTIVSQTLISVPLQTLVCVETKVHVQQRDSHIVWQDNVPNVERTMIAKTILQNVLCVTQTPTCA